MTIDNRGTLSLIWWRCKKNWQADLPPYRQIWMKWQLFPLVSVPRISQWFAGIQDDIWMPWYERNLKTGCQKFHEKHFKLWLHFRLLCSRWYLQLSRI